MLYALIYYHFLGPMARVALFVFKEITRKNIVEKEGHPEEFYKIAASDKYTFDVFVNHLYQVSLSNCKLF